MLNRLIARFRKKPELPAIRVPTFEQFQTRRPPRLLVASILAMGGIIASYLACPTTRQRIESVPVQSIPKPPLPVPKNEALAIPDEESAQIVDTRKRKTIYIGPRGGRYHYSANGGKVYEKKK